MKDAEPISLQIDGHDIGEYKIVSAASRVKLEKEVNTLIQQKWFPIGGPFTTNTSDGPALLQALVRSKFAQRKTISHVAQ